jgi:uncharacterized damage-inducible protein DinB
MTHSELMTLVDFHYWARDRVLEAVGLLSADDFTRNLGSSFPSVRDTLVHIYSAEWNWYSRWQGVSPSAMLDPREYPDLQTLTAAWSEQERQLRAYVGSLDDDAVCRVHYYKALNGTPQESVFWQMLQHLVNHGTYHRGQIATMLRQLGATPARSVDLITYYREVSAAGA